MFSIHEDSWYSVQDTLNFNDFFDYKKIKTTKQVTYYNDIVAFDIETTSFEEETEEVYLYDEVYNYLLGTKIRISQQTYEDIPDFNSIRVSLFGRLYFSKSEGIRIDSLYRDLVENFPYCFDEDIINPSDQLDRIIQVFCENSPVKDDEDNKRAVMYVWQIAINGNVIIGRTFEEFVQLMNQISERYHLSVDQRLIVWVHNLSFEFAWIKDYFTWDKVFAISTRKPIYALTTTGIEFRCSYMLSNLSLANVGKSLTKYNVSKLEGELNYDLKRHYKTPLTEQEIHYCINDVLVVSAYIKELMEKPDAHNDITRLPLTATGYCRNYVRKNCLVGDNKEEQFRKYHEMIRHLTISGIEEYNQMQRAFMGGFTHCSCRHSGKKLACVDSFDFTSSYPYVLCSEKFPMSKGKVINVTSYKQLKELCKYYCVIFDVKFIGLVPKYINENYISVSKCLDENLKPLREKDRAKYNIVTNNGRVVGGDIITTLTNIDFEIIDKVYKWKKISIGTCRIYKKDYLPREIIISILELYKAKTTLKNVPGQEDFYQKGKQLLNSIYGMMVTSVLMPIHSYDNEQGWTIEHKEAEKELKKYNKSKKRFLYYPWGIFCTAYARRNLWTGILAFGDDFIYADTDSLKVLNAEHHMDYINAYNRMVIRKLEMVSKHYDIPMDYFKPKTIKGVEKPLGVWDKETTEAEGGQWKFYKSLGAKRYMILTGDDKLTISVSGVNKKYAIPYLLDKYGKEKAFDAFTEDLIIPAEYYDKEGNKKDGTGKLTHYYIDEPTEGELTDYLGNTIHYHSLSGVCLEKTSYKFTIEAEYLSYLKQIQGVLI